MHSQLKTEIPRRWQTMALMLWFLIAGSFLIVYVVDLPLSYSQTSSPCQGEDCHYQAITPAEAQALQDLGLSTSFYAAYIMGITVAAVAVYAGLALLILYYQSRQLVGLVLSLMLMVMPAIMITNFDVVAETYPAWKTPVNLLFVLGQVLVVLFFLIFPNGRLVPRWSAANLLLMVAATVPNVVAGADLLPLTFAFFFATVVGTIIVVIYRYRRIFSLSERQQVKWALLGFIGVVLASAAWGMTYEFLTLSPGRPQLWLMMGGWTLCNLFLILAPIGLAMSILRYRLWDIDIVIRRTLVYTLLTLILLMVYFASIVLLQTAFTATIDQQSPVAIVASTLVIAALFQPVRKRVQSFIDRRFYRSKYDAAQAVEQFAIAARDEVGLEQLSDALMGTVQRALQPEHLSLWLKDQT